MAPNLTPRERQMRVREERERGAVMAMSRLGLDEKLVVRKFRSLVKVYGSFEFIEAENYRVLADELFSEQDRHANNDEVPGEGKRDADVDQNALRRISRRRSELGTARSSQESQPECGAEGRALPRSQPQRGAEGKPLPHSQPQRGAEGRPLPQSHPQRGAEGRALPPSQPQRVGGECSPAPQPTHDLQAPLGSGTQQAQVFLEAPPQRSVEGRGKETSHQHQRGSSTFPPPCSTDSRGTQTQVDVTHHLAGPSNDARSSRLPDRKPAGPQVKVQFIVTGNQFMEEVEPRERAEASCQTEPIAGSHTLPEDWTLWETGGRRVETGNDHAALQEDRGIPEKRKAAAAEPLPPLKKPKLEPGTAVYPALTVVAASPPPRASPARNYNGSPVSGPLPLAIRAPSGTYGPERDLPPGFRAGPLFSTVPTISFLPAEDPGSSGNAKTVRVKLEAEDAIRLPSHVQPLRKASVHAKEMASQWIDPAASVEIPDNGQATVPSGALHIASPLHEHSLRRSIVHSWSQRDVGISNGKLLADRCNDEEVVRDAAPAKIEPADMQVDAAAFQIQPAQKGASGFMVMNPPSDGKARQVDANEVVTELVRLATNDIVVEQDVRKDIESAELEARRIRVTKNEEEPILDISLASSNPVQLDQRELPPALVALADTYNDVDDDAPCPMAVDGETGSDLGVEPRSFQDYSCLDIPNVEIDCPSKPAFKRLKSQVTPMGETSLSSHGANVKRKTSVDRDGRVAMQSTCKQEAKSTQTEKIGKGKALAIVDAISPPVDPICMEYEKAGLDTLDFLHDRRDISCGRESVPISWVNDSTSESLPSSFHYISKTVVYQSALLVFTLTRIDDENCCDCNGDCLKHEMPCHCSARTGGIYAYGQDGCLVESILDQYMRRKKGEEKSSVPVYCLKACPFAETGGKCRGHNSRPFIKECWDKCRCNVKLCGNRVVQRGITRRLQVFWTPEGKGWGLRTLEDLPRGAFVCEYVGEILTNAELDRRNKSNEDHLHHYPINLDGDWAAEESLEDNEALCLDATYFGNVARFVNHRCFDSNMLDVAVEIESPDHHYYHVAFFTTREVKANQELTWDYQIDFEDVNHPVKAFACRCGSTYCRGSKRRV